jgi:hypothetical protein
MSVDPSPRPIYDYNNAMYLMKVLCVFVKYSENNNELFETLKEGGVSGEPYFGYGLGSFDDVICKFISIDSPGATGLGRKILAKFGERISYSTLRVSFLGVVAESTLPAFCPSKLKLYVDSGLVPILENLIVISSRTAAAEMKIDLFTFRFRSSAEAATNNNHRKRMQFMSNLFILFRFQLLLSGMRI